MNSNGKFWEIGLKVLAAAVVGIAVFVGIDKSTSRRESNSNNNNNGSQNQQNISNSGPGNWQQPNEQPIQDNVNQKQDGNISNTSANVRGDNNRHVGEKVVSGLKGMYGTFGKLTQVISSLVDVVGSVGRLFGKDSGYNYPPQQPYYTNNPWGCGCNLSPGLHRVNDYIIQVGPSPQGQQFGNNYNYGCY